MNNCRSGFFLAPRSSKKDEVSTIDWNQTSFFFGVRTRSNNSAVQGRRVAVIKATGKSVD